MTIFIIAKNEERGFPYIKGDSKVEEAHMVEVK
jgi:hypothetical protein